MKADEFVLVDDDCISNKINKRYLSKLYPDIMITMFDNAEDALSYLISMQDDPKKIIVFLDLNMPVMNGFEFMSIYENSLAYQKPNFLICLLTNSTNQEDKKKAKKFPSIVNYTSKPLDKMKIKKIVDDISLYNFA